MASNTDQFLEESLSYKITKKISGPIERVWACWLEARHLKHWFCPAGFKVLNVECEPVVNGKWFVSFESAEGDIYETNGEFLELSAYKQLKMTQQWKGSDDHSEINISLENEGNFTMLTFEHTLIKSEELVDSFREGWEEALTNLEKHVLP